MTSHRVVLGSQQEYNQMKHIPFDFMHMAEAMAFTDALDYVADPAITYRRVTNDEPPSQFRPFGTVFKYRIIVDDQR